MENERRVLRQRISPTLYLLLGLILAAACSGSGRPVARVGDAVVGQDDWRAYLRTRAASGKAPDVPAALAEVTRREVAVQLAEKRGLLSTPDWAERTRMNRREILGKAYLAAQPSAPPLGEAEAEKFYLEHNQERNVSHILTKSPEEAGMVLSRLKAGEAFEKLAKEFSKDTSAKENGGSLGWIRREQMVPAFGDAVFQAGPGELVGPFKSEFGWHVALVKETRGPTAEDFQKDRVNILDKIAKMQESAHREAVLKPLREKYPLTPDTEVLELDRTVDLSQGDEGRIAGRVVGETISLKDLKMYIADALSTSGQSHSLGPETKTRFMDTLADTYRLARAARDAGLDKRPEVKADLWDRDRQSALAAFSESYLSPFQPSETALREHYASHPDRFLDLGSAHLNIIITESRERAEQALPEALAGTSWKVLYDRYANRESTGDWDMGWVELSKLRPYLPTSTLNAMIGKPLGYVAGPATLPDGFALFKVLERRPGPVMPFDGCKDMVRFDYLREKGPDIVAAYLDGEGRKGLEVVTFPDRAAAPAEDK